MDASRVFGHPALIPLATNRWGRFRRWTTPIPRSQSS
jgi:hypothetical protein